MNSKILNINLSKDLHAVYFIGIGGIGVSGLACWCLKNNIKVFGYDREDSQITKELKLAGANIYHNSIDLETYNQHDFSITKNDNKNNMSHEDALYFFNHLGCSNTLVVYSSAINKDHSILSLFNQLELFTIKRAQFLGLIAKSYDVIAIAGTHGKTTISCMLTHILKVGGIDCSAFLGGVPTNYGSNFIEGKSNVMIVEADEFDKSFLHLNPTIILISALDRDHLDTYPTLEDMLSGYTEFILNSYKSKKLQKLILKLGLKNKLNSISSFPGQIEYSINSSAKEGYVLELNFLGEKHELKFLKQGEHIMSFNIPLMPHHNIENFLASSCIALELGIKPESIIQAVYSFSGISRRFEYHIKNKTQIFIEDYAHHPKEIDVLISSVRNMYPSQKITLIFQPHLFSRTKDFLDDFATALSKVDMLILLDIYGAREFPIKGFGIDNLFCAIHLKNKKLISNNDLLPLIEELKPKLLISAGAGNISDFSKSLKKILA